MNYITNDKLPQPLFNSIIEETGLEPYQLQQLIDKGLKLPNTKIVFDFEDMVKIGELVLKYANDNLTECCPVCNGEGTVNELNCKNQSNECCGGCLDEKECDNCNGKGEL
jgi:hypothetical protein